jgi:hypothetical protein
MHANRLLIFAALALSGCIGSSILVDDTDTSATFPDLHSVPERPVLPDRATNAATTESLSKDHQKDLEENKHLREQFGLNIQP